MPSQKVGPLGYVGPHQEWHQPHNSSPSSRSSSWKPRPLKQMHQISSPDQLLRVHPGCITLLVSSKPWVNTFPNHIYCHNLGDPSQVLDARAWTIGEGINNFGQPPGKTLFPRWENSRKFSGFFSRALLHVFRKCRSCCSVPRPPTCQRICNLFQSRFLKTKLLLSPKKTHIISGPALFLFRRKHPTPPSPRLHQTSEHWGQPAADAPQGRPRNQLSTTGEPGCQLISDGS